MVTNMNSRSERQKVYVGDEESRVGVGCSVVLYLKNVTRNKGLCIGEEKERSEGMLEGGL